MIKVTCCRYGKRIKDRHGNLLGYRYNKKLKGEFTMEFESIEALVSFCRFTGYGNVIFLHLKEDLTPEQYTIFRKKLKAMHHYHYDCPRSRRKESRLHLLHR